MIKVLFRHFKGYYISSPASVFSKILEVQDIEESTIRALVLKMFEQEIEELDELKLIPPSALTLDELAHFSTEEQKTLRESAFLVRAKLLTPSGESQYIIQYPEVEVYIPDFAAVKSLLTHSHPGIRNFAKETLGDSNDD